MRAIRTVSVFAAAVVVSLATGCASEPEQPGYLSTYANLKPVTATTLRYVAPDDVLARYSAFVVEPVSVRLYEPEGWIDADDQQHMQQYMYEAVRNALRDRYKLVPDPGPGVARLRIAITNLKANTPALDVLPPPDRKTLKLGEASIEAELIDSQTGVQLAAAIDSGAGGRFSFAELSNWRDVEAVTDDWAKRIRRRLDEAHARAADRP